VSYARKTARIKVGRKAASDPVLAEASLRAAKILKKAVDAGRGRRMRVIRQQLRTYGPGSFETFRRARSRMIQRGVSRNQSLFDALRLVIVNQLAQVVTENIAAAAAQAGDASGLGKFSVKKLGCGVTGGAGVVGGIVASIYGGEGGGTAVGTGTGVLSETMGCNKGAREAAQRLADTQAQAAQMTADAAVRAAQLQADSAANAERQKTARVKTAVIGGGIVLLLLGTGYAILKT